MSAISKYVNKIICGDCLEVMRDWPDNCVDLVLTDPVYQDIDSYKYLFEQSGRLLNSTGQLICYFADIYLPEIMNLDKFGLNWIKLIVERNVGVAGTLWKYHCKTGCKHALWFYKSNLPNDINWITDFYYSKPDGDNVFHTWGKNFPTLYEMIIRHTKPNNIILDPFCGSGTTCVAAKMLGRKYIGIDISEEYCRIARQRLEAVDTGVPVREQNWGQQALFK